MLQPRSALGLGATQAALRFAISSSETSKFNLRFGTSNSISSPSCTNASGPPAVDSGETCNTTVPNHIFKLNKKYTAPKLVISVWGRYFGNSVTGICPICDKQIKSGKNGFVCKPIISLSKGGEETIENLRPICNVCNKDMGKKNWDDYIKNKKKSKI